jgi:S1-C subfamily serine protease
MTKAKHIFFSAFFIPLISFGQTSVAIAKSAINSTISIVALDNASQPLAYGSGFIIDDKLIATNVHVIEGAASAYVLINGVTKNLTVDGYVAIDKAHDLVILKVSNLHGTKLTLNSTTLPQIGETIYAVGNPKGLSGTFSEGIVSGIRELNGNQVLQITAPISPGSSGGPVLNSKGEVVGIAFASFSGGQNLNFAIPVKYLHSLETKISSTQSLSVIKQKTNAESQSITPNSKESVIVRNLSYWSHNVGVNAVSFSIKNNLQYTISDIDILILIYDNTGTVVDYKLDTYFHNNLLESEEQGIKPYLAHLANAYSIPYNIGYKLEARILNYKILDTK